MEMTLSKRAVGTATALAVLIGIDAVFYKSVTPLLLATLIVITAGAYLFVNVQLWLISPRQWMLASLSFVVTVFAFFIWGSQLVHAI